MRSAERWLARIAGLPAWLASCVVVLAPLVLALAGLPDIVTAVDVAIVVAGYMVGGVAWVLLGGRRHTPPSSLPPPPTRMAGREELAQRLRSYLLGDAVPRRMANISGVAGIGKTAFALSVAHQVTPGFPGGQLFAHFEPGQDPVQAAHSIRRQFIQALRPPGARVPPSERGQGALYQRLIKRRRRENQLLIVLDDVPDPNAIRLLLPDSPWCAVIVTSRVPVKGLDMRQFELGELSQEAAVRMLTAIIGSERVRKEASAAQDLVRAAALHPLAIQLVGMALANRPNLWLAVARQRMTDSDGPRKGTFSNALDLSYAMLTAGEQRALTMLGLLAQRRFAAWELGALLGVGETEAWMFCDRLTDAGLLARRSLDVAGVQFFMLLEHVEEYARRRVRELPAGAVRRAVSGLARAREHRMRRTTAPGVFERVQVILEEGTISRAFKEARDAVGLARELTDVRGEAEATVMLAQLHAELGGSEDVRDLLDFPLQPGSSAPETRIRALRISAKLHRRVRQIEQARAALAEATRLNTPQRDAVEEIRLLREVAIVESVGPTPRAGMSLIRQAKALLEERQSMPDSGRLRAGLAYAEGRVLLALGLPAKGLDVLRAGAEAASANRQPLWAAWIGYQEARAVSALGQHSQALTHAAQAMKEFIAMRHRYGSAHCRQLIGQALAAQDDLDGAIRFYGEALETFHNCGDAWVEAETAKELAAVYQRRGDATNSGKLLATARHLYLSIGANSQAAQIESVRPMAVAERWRLTGLGMGGR